MIPFLREDDSLKASLIESFNLSSTARLMTIDRPLGSTIVPVDESQLEVEPRLESDGRAHGNVESSDRERIGVGRR